METTPAGEERKVVSVLFVDLVGFTDRSDRADPEDVRATLRPYHERVKADIERFGGTVEKFIGDAVMAVFGAPVAHEDDAERAVRAALRILETIEELRAEGLDVAVRAAVTTGQAVVSLGARPERGEGMVAGDVVNTAARLQSAAPVGSVIVDATTMRSAQAAIGFEPLDPVAAKGKHEPIPVWRASEARSRFGVDTDLRAGTLFVGRDSELALLGETFSRALREPSAQLVTVVGEPGLGKSRLVWEFRQEIDRRPDLVRWRQGRCLPYGEGITFWALGEIVKAEAGILETDSPTQALDKLSRSLADTVSDESERAWFIERLSPLVGAQDDPASVGTRGGVLGLAPLSRGACSSAAHRARARGPALGGRRPSRLRRASLRLGHRGAAHGSGDGPTRAPRRTSGLGRRTPKLGHRRSLAARGRGHRASGLRAARAFGALGRDASRPARARRRQPALHRAVRAHARRPRGLGRGSAARDRAGADRRAHRHARPRVEGASPRRLGPRKGLLGRRPRRDGRPLT